MFYDPGVKRAGRQCTLDVSTDGGFKLIALGVWQPVDLVKHEPALPGERRGMSEGSGAKGVRAVRWL